MAAPLIPTVGLALLAWWVARALGASALAAGSMALVLGLASAIFYLVLRLDLAYEPLAANRTTAGFQPPHCRSGEVSIEPDKSGLNVWLDGKGELPIPRVIQEQSGIIYYEDSCARSKKPIQRFLILDKDAWVDIANATPVPNHLYVVEMAEGRRVMKRIWGGFALPPKRRIFWRDTLMGGAIFDDDFCVLRIAEIPDPC